jgi:hypothetical protein
VLRRSVPRVTAASPDFYAIEELLEPAEIEIRRTPVA